MARRLIGPRRPSGAFYKKRPTAAKPRATRKGSALNTAIMRVLNRNLETKYVAQQAGLTTPLFVNGDISPATDYISICPLVAQQTAAAASNVRCGEQIKPLKATINVDLWFANQTTNNARTVFVKAFFVSAKSVRKCDPTIVAPLPTGLLEDGSSDPVPWKGTLGSLQRYYPVCKDNYTVHSIKTVKLVMNATDPISGTSPYPDGQSDRKSISFSWTPPTLKYNLEADQFPQNHAPLMFLVAYSPGFIYPTDASLVNSVQYSYQTCMTFKDA